MKKLIPILILSLSGAAGLVAHADTVTSVNAVGMVKFELERGTLSMLSLPFDMSTETVNASDLFGDTLPPGSSVFFWDAQNQVWVGDTYTQGLFGNPNFWSPGTTSYGRGDGIFIRIPDTAASASYELVLTGEVPGTSTASTTTRDLESGKLFLVGSGYPVSISVSDPSLGLNPTPGDSIIIWDSSIGGYVGTTYSQGLFGNPDSWSNPNLEIAPGMGFFYRSMGEQTWIIEKNDLYIWP